MFEKFDKDRISKNHGITDGDLKEFGYSWQSMEDIYNDYCVYAPSLEPGAHYIASLLRTVPAVHSIRQRVKNPDRLIAKIIRKKKENPQRDINLGNYRQEFTDLLGLRAIHLYKNDWQTIHAFIKQTWYLHEEPIAYYREGDSTDLQQIFKELGCIPQIHPKGYRSVHYVVRVNPTIQDTYAEIQVRTIFEEGWSEIDHQIRYPDLTSDIMIGNFLGMFNRFAGSADEMGSFVRDLSSHLAETEARHLATYTALEAKISDIENISAKDKRELREEINRLKSVPTFYDVFHGMAQAASNIARAMQAISPGTLENYAKSVEELQKRRENAARALAERQDKMDSIKRQLALTEKSQTTQSSSQDPAPDDRVEKIKEVAPRKKREGTKRNG